MNFDDIRRDYPILEFDNTSRAVIEPSEILKNKPNIPDRFVLVFFNELIQRLVQEGLFKEIHHLKSEMGRHVVYVTEYQGENIGVMHPAVGAPLAVGLMEEIIALGANKIIAVGACGVLQKDIAKGQPIIPTSAIRDEGTSYHYLAPTREVSQQDEGIRAIESVLTKHSIPFLKGKTWTTDAFYRETRKKVSLRVSEGCLTVEMEAAAFFAVAEFRKITFGQLLYGGDDVSGEIWDSRSYFSATDIREKLFWLAVEAVLELGN